ncbi:MAG: FeoB small GTPase domain-containing protein, partial [Bacteroidia bacterium]
MLAEPNQSFVHFLDKKTIKVALVGNPNSGKSTLFNALTGLSQKTGNFPGVTIDKKTGSVKLKSTSLTDKEVITEFIDLPGTYSLYPKSPDEQVTFDVLCNPNNTDYPDVVVVVADASNLKRNLFLVSQIIDLKIPTILVLNMMDLVEKQSAFIDVLKISELLGIRVLPVSARAQQGIEHLKQALLEPLPIPNNNFIDVKNIATKLVEKISSITGVTNPFVAFHTISNFSKIDYFNKQQQQQIALAINESAIDVAKLQSQETIERYTKINSIVDACFVKKNAQQGNAFTNKLDKLLTHPVWG